MFLDFNKLSRLPEEIGNLKLLEDFNLEDNVRANPHPSPHSNLSC